jgi:polyisoprenoid-binding protein YceI
MKRYITVWVIICCSFSSLVHAQSALTPYTYNIGFTIKNAGITVSGSLKGLQADILFSPELLPTSKISASIQVNTINTGNNTRDNHLKRDDYFDAVKYPLINFNSIKLYRKANSYAGLFNVTIKNTTRQVEIPFTYTETDDQATFEANLTIDRRDYDVGGYSLVLSDEVNIHILVNAKK